MGNFSDLTTAASATGLPLSLLLSLVGAGVIALLALIPPPGGNDEDDGGSGGGGLMQPAYATVRRGR
jgi:hypothetical protein